jgi:4-alpha-glucanotransferase
MNVPGRADGNWNWRCTEEMLSVPALQWLRDLTESSKRSDSAGISRASEILQAIS